MLSDKNHVRGIVPQRRACEIAEQFRDAKACARQQVLNLVAEEVADAEGIREALDAPVWMRDAIN